MVPRAQGTVLRTDRQGAHFLNDHLRPTVAYMSPYTAHIQARACHHYRLLTCPVRRSRGSVSPQPSQQMISATRSSGTLDVIGFSSR